ncbi:MAG: type IV pilus twitching motility protein PilT [Roseburia sp.]|nr:type IV pilus twitching motility protein PilT [Roseburia sp.]
MMETTIENLLTYAKQKGASDLHITVGIRPKCRIQGTLVEVEEAERVMPELAKTLVTSMLGPDQERAINERGEVDFAYTLPQVGRFRVNAFKQRGSYAAVLRLVASEIPSAESLGIPASVVRLTEKKRGMVLLTGPTGSGKSTTLASLIDIINREQNVHIITLEDPIEYLHRHDKAIVNQREIGLDTKSYANALRAALREDPDIILVGEMRDLDTISTAITAAETGHLVFSTLHTIGAAPTIDRIIDVFPPHQQTQVRVQLASVLECIISQQLLPTMDKKSRVAAFEVMHGTPAIKNLVREGQTHQIDSMIQTSKKLGMQTMDDALFELYLRHRIDGERAVEYAQNSQAMQEKLF